MRLPHAISYITLALTLFLILLMGYWTFYPYKTFEYVGEKSLIMNKDKKVKAGDFLRVQTNLEHFTDGVTVIVSPQIIDGTVVNFPDFHYITRKGKQVFERSFEIPDYLPSGIYHIEIQSHIKVNPIRTINIIRLSEDFTIIECPHECIK